MRAFRGRVSIGRVYRLFFRTLQSRLFGSTIALCLLALGMLAAFTLVQSNRQYTRNINETNLLNLRHIDATMQNYLDRYRNNAVVLLKDVNVNAMLATGSYSWDYNTARSAALAHNLLYTDDTLNAIAMLNNDGLQMICQKTAITSESRKKAWDALFSRTENGKIAFTTMRIMSNNDPLGVLCAFYGQDEADRRSGILLEINADVLMEGLFPSPQPKDTALAVVSSAQEVAMRNNHHSSYLNSLPELIGDSGVIELDESMMLSYVCNARYGYSIVSVTPIPGIDAATTGGVLIFAFAVLGILSMIAFVIARRLYHPLGAVIEDMRNLSGGRQNLESLNDIQLMLISLNYIVRRINDLQKAWDQDNIIRYLHDSTADPPESLRPNTDYGGGHIIIGIDIDDEPDESIHTLLMSALAAIITDSMQLTAHCEVLRDSACRTVIILRESARGGAFNDISWASELKNMRHFIEQHMNLSVTIAISPYGCDTDDYRALYGYVTESLKRKALMGKGRILTDAGDQHVRISRRAVDSLLHAIRNDNNDLMHDAVVECIDCVRAATHQHGITQLAELAVEITASIHPACEINYDNCMLLDHYEKLAEITSRDLLEAYFIRLCQYAAAQKKRSLSAQKSSIISNALTYINEHFDDPALSMQSIANELNENLSNLSRSFNEYTGETFPSYLNNLRLNAARKRLLEQPETDIAHIAASVGFNSPSYFSTVFRRKFGITPKQARKHGGGAV